MAKTKDQCPECCTYTVSLTSANCDYLLLEKRRHKKKGKFVSIEKLVNGIVAKEAIRKDHEI